MSESVSQKEREGENMVHINSSSLSPYVCVCVYSCVLVRPFVCLYVFLSVYQCRRGVKVQTSLARCHSIQLKDVQQDNK